MADFWMLLIIALGLAMDCLAVSLGIGSSPAPCTPRTVFRLSSHFGLFQGGMTLIGWLLGSTVVDQIAAIDHWIALTLLAWVGGRMIYEGLSWQEAQPQVACQDPTRAGTLVMLSIATSIDALGVGLSLAFLRINVAAASLLIGLVSLLLTILGLLSGKQLSRQFGRGMEVLGGLMLIGIGLRIALTHMLA